MGRYQVIAEDIRLMEEKLQSLKGSIPEEKYEELLSRIDDIKRLGVDLPDDFDELKVQEVIERMVGLQFDEFSPQFVKESTKEIKRVAFLQRLEFLLNRIEEREDIGGELEEAEQYWSSLERYYDDIENRDVRQKLDEVRLENTLTKIKKAKVVKMEDIDIKQSHFLVRERLQSLLENNELGDEEKCLITAWLGESVDIKSGTIDSEAMDRLLMSSKVWSVLAGEKEYKAERAKVAKEHSATRESKDIAKKKNREETEERKREIKDVCKKYGLKESYVRALLKFSRDDICIVGEEEHQYRAIPSKRFRRGWASASEVRAIIYNNANRSGVYRWKKYHPLNVSEVVLPDYITTIGESAFECCGYLKSIRIPKEVKRIDMSAFRYTALKSIELPDSLESLGHGAFAQSHLENITFGKGLRSIEAEAFDSNHRLRAVEIPENIEVIGEDAFAGCNSLKTVKLSEGLKEIEHGAFSYTGLEKVELPESLEVLGTCAFAYAHLTDVKLGSGIDVIPQMAFYHSKLESVDIPSNVKVIRWGAFQYSTLKDVTFHEGLQEIGTDAFSSTKVDSLTLPMDVVYT